MIQRNVTEKWEIIWMEAAVVYFKALHSPGGTEEKHEKLRIVSLLVEI
jgi:hypothetical protein